MFGITAHFGSGLGWGVGRERLSYISVLIYVSVAGECVRVCVCVLQEDFSLWFGDDERSV